MTDFYDPESESGRGYEPEAKKSKWWWDDHNYDHRDHSYSKGSGSRGWMSKIGGYSDDYWKPKKDTKEVYQELLDQLQNSANLIGNDERGTINVQWSDGRDTNDPKKDAAGSQTIYLSPDNLITSGSSGSEVSEESLDAMTGKVYLASTLRETVDATAYEQAKIARIAAKAKQMKITGHHHCPCNSGKYYGSCCAVKTAAIDVGVTADAVKIWEAIETSIARSKIIEDWAGFGPYVAADAERSTASKQEVQDYIDATSETEPTTEAASLAIAWNLLNASDPITIPDCYDECIEAAVEMMEDEIAPEDRFQSCVELSDRIAKIIKKKREEGSEGEGEDNESSEGESNDDGSEGESEASSSSGEGDSKGGTPKVCDSSLLGDTVENKTDAELSEQEGNGGEDDAEDGGSISAEAPENMCDLGAKFDMVKFTIRPEYVTSYNRIVNEHRTEIRSIRSSLQFRSNVAKMVSYGHRSGDIDENSLFKIRMDDDRVMTKTDMISSKKIAICLLVDESGSMGCGNRVEDARNTAIIINESLRGMDGMSVSIYGHSAEESTKHPNLTLREYFSPRQTNAAACMEISARMQNHDSYAIQHTASIFNKDYHDYDRKILFVISDGEPAGSSYGGKPAMSHMLAVSQACDKRGIEVYGVGIDNAFSNAAGKLMYGDNRFVVLDDVKSSLGVMSRFIRQIAMK